MIDCLSDPTRLAAMAADAQRVAADISWPVIAQKTLALYERMLKRQEKHVKLS